MIVHAFRACEEIARFEASQTSGLTPQEWPFSQAMGLHHQVGFGDRALGPKCEFSGVINLPLRYYSVQELSTVRMEMAVIAVKAGVNQEEAS